MGVAVRVIGFDRSTERYAAEVAIPSHHWTKAREIAEVPASDPELMGSYPLDDVQARQIAGVTGALMDPRLDWFLEADAVTPPATPP